MPDSRCRTPIERHPHDRTTTQLRPDWRCRTRSAQVVDVSKTYGRGAEPVHALRNVTAAFAPGTFTAIMGPSGSGKSTLLHVAAGLDRPTSGDVRSAAPTSPACRRRR